MICAESEVLERHLDFLTGKSLLLTGAVNDEFLSDLRRQGFNACAWSWYFDYANRENQKQQSAVDFSLEFQCQADLILFYWTKNKQECHVQLMQMLAKSPMGQEILIVGENRSGVRSAENRLADFGDIHKIDSARRCSLYHFQLKNPPHFDLNSFCHRVCVAGRIQRSRTGWRHRIVVVHVKKCVGRCTGYRLWRRRDWQLHSKISSENQAGDDGYSRHGA